MVVHTITNWVKTHFKLSIIIGAIIFVALLVILIVVIANPKQTVKVTQTQIGLEYQQKLPGLKQAVEQTPKSAEARKNYGVALYATGDVEGAKKQYEEAVKADNKDAVAFNNLGNTYRDLGQNDKAIDAYETAINLSPKSLNSYANLANIQLYSKNKPQDAIATYKKGLQHLPDNVQLLQLLAVAYEQANDKTNAIKTYQTITTIDPANTAAKSAIERLK